MHEFVEDLKFHLLEVFIATELEAFKNLSDKEMEETIQELKTLRKNNDIMKKLLVTIETINNLLKNKSFQCQCKKLVDNKVKTKLNILNNKYIELKNGLETISDNKLTNSSIVIKRDPQKRQTNDLLTEKCGDIQNTLCDIQSVEDTNGCVDKSNDINNQTLVHTKDISSHEESDDSVAKDYDEEVGTAFSQMDDPEYDYEYCCEFSDSKTGILCQKKFTTKETLLNHVIGHSGQKPWFCEFPDCDYRSVLRSHLIGHIRKSHTARHQFQCDWPGCDFRGPSRYNVKRHKIIHTNEKPYKCDWPGCDFRSPNNKIAEHKRIHTGEKPYMCSWVGCEARFSRSFTLRNHLRTHTGEKPFKCDYPNCQYSSTQQTPLATHKRKYHNWRKESSEEVIFTDNIVSTDE